MALNYLLSPEFQIVNSAGRPASNGFLEVFHHGTRDRYYCASDFNGTLHPFQVPLDSLGGNVVLADDSHAYDVYIYNRYGSLLMSRYNVHPSSGGSMGGVITSSDGSVKITPTQDGYDLSTRDNKASTFRAAADSLYADGYFSFRKIEGEGEAIYLDNGSIKLEDGWYHFSATVKLSWTGSNVNDASTVRLYSGATYDVIDFDFSYNHSDTVVLDGDIWIGAHSTHYISFGRDFSLGVTGMRQGMTAELVDCDLHSIIGQGVGGEYFAGYGIKISEEKVISVDTSVVATQADLEGKQDTLTAGSNITISDNVISATDTTYTAGTGIDITGDVISADTSVVATKSDLAGKQDTLTAGTGITIQNNVISATAAQQVQSNWNESDPSSVSYIQNKPDLSIYAESANLATVATTGSYDDLTDKPDLSIYAEKADLATVATTGDYDDLTNKPSIPTKTSDLTNDSGFITASDIPAQVQSDWTETDTSDPAYIAHKPSLATVATSGDYGDLLNKPTINNVPAVTSSDNDKVLKASYSGGVGSYSWETDQGTAYSAGTGIDITDNAISAKVDGTTISTNASGELTANIPLQVQSDWAESDSSDPSYIQNKPTEKTLAAGSNVTITEANDTVTISATNTTYTAGTGVDITSGVISADTSVLATQSDLNGKQDTLTAGSNISISNNVISATDTAYSAGTGIDITGTTISADTSVLATQSDLSSKQDTLTAGTNIQINGTTISATDTTYSAGTGLSLNGTTFSNADPIPAHTSSDEGKVLKVDSNGDLEWGAESGGTVTDVQVNGTSVVSGGVADITVQAQVNSDWAATSGVAEILNKPTEKTLVAGTNVTITEANDIVTVSATNTTYTAGTGVDITSGVISADTSVLATQSDLSSKQDTLTAGSNISISNNVISATDTTYSAGTGISISNQNEISNADPIPAHTSSDEGKVLGVDSNGDLEWTASGGTQVQSDWTEADTTDPSYIQNKPLDIGITEGSGITFTNSGASVSIGVTIPVPSFNPISDVGKVLTITSGGVLAWVTP